MDLTSFLAALKLPIKVLAGVGAVAAGILFLPSGWVDVLGLSTMRKQHTDLLGIALLLAVALLLIEAVALTVSWLRRKAEHQREGHERHEAAEHEKQERQRQRKREREALFSFLEGMTEPERALCRPFIQGEVRTALLSVEDGNVYELVRRQVLYGSGSPSHYDRRLEGNGADFTMTDWAWDYLREHPELVKPRPMKAPVR
jgi:hypothetical protein